MLALIPEHHNLSPSSVHALGPHRPEGWLLSTHTARPADVPVWWLARTWVRLDDLGGVVPVTPGEQQLLGLDGSQPATGILR